MDQEYFATYREEQSSYAWALLNGACDGATQREFDALQLEPIDPEGMAHDGYSMVRARSIDFEFAVS